MSKSSKMFLNLISEIHSQSLLLNTQLSRQMWKKILLVLEVVTEDELSAKWKRFGGAEGDDAD